MASGSPLLGTRLPARISTPSGAASFPGPSLRCQASSLFSRTRRGAATGAGRSRAKNRPWQAGVAVVECKEIDCLDLCRHDSSSSRRLRSARSTTSRAASCVDWRMTGGPLIDAATVESASSGLSQIENHVHGLTVCRACHPTGMLPPSSTQEFSGRPGLGRAYIPLRFGRP